AVMHPQNNFMDNSAEGTDLNWQQRQYPDSGSAAYTIPHTVPSSVNKRSVGQFPDHIPQGKFLNFTG
ncbi:hypothetical protein, partial [Oceanospirillum sediminis]|uniref:hypothetical protein n=1 Tax=Oceanospirillum sediminis TaxID=2760088 RepID=UPI001C7254CC